MPEEKTDLELDQVIDDLLECYSVTNQLMPYCLEMGGEHVQQRHFQTMMEVTELTKTATDLLLKNSIYGKGVVQLCVNACEALAASSRNIRDDQNMQTLAEVNDKCAQSCRSFTGVK